jgi:hypothetical protein
MCYCHFYRRKVCSHFGVGLRHALTHARRKHAAQGNITRRSTRVSFRLSLDCAIKVSARNSKGLARTQHHETKEKSSNLAVSSAHGFGPQGWAHDMKEGLAAQPVRPKIAGLRYHHHALRKLCYPSKNTSAWTYVVWPPGVHERSSTRLQRRTTQPGQHLGLMLCSTVSYSRNRARIVALIHRQHPESQSIG